MAFFRAIKKGLLLMSITLAVIGYYLVIKGRAFILIAFDILAYVLIGAGIIEIIRYQFLKIDERYRRNDFVFGLATVVAGVFLLLTKKNLSAFAEIALSILIVISAVFKIQDSFDCKKIGHGHFGIYITLVIICLAIAALVFLNPFTDSTLYLVLGIGLMFSGISDFISNIYLAALRFGVDRRERKISKENANAEAERIKIEEEQKEKLRAEEIRKQIEKEKEDEINNSHMTRIDL